MNLEPQGLNTPAAVYARVSSEDQAERQTIQAQVDFARRWCDLHQVHVVDWYLDDGVSGAIPLGDRPEGHRLLQDARAGRFRQVLVYRLDRLARNTRHLLDAVDELSRHGVALRSMTEQFDTETATGRFVLTTLASIAELERATIVERTAQGRLRRAREGRWQGGPVPYGYVLDEEGRLVVNDEPIPGHPWSEADVVRLIFAHLAEGGTTVQIAEHLTSLGIPARFKYQSRGGQVKVRSETPVWRSSRIRTIVRNPVYKGELRLRIGREEVTATCPPIVTPELWEVANRVMRANRSLPKHGSTRLYLLRGLIRCGLCGRGYVGSSAQSKGYRYYLYRCAGASRSIGSWERCQGKPVSAARLEDEIWQQAEAILRGQPPGEDPEAATSEVTARLQREAIEHALRRKAVERDRVLGLYRRGLIDDATLERQLKEIEAEEHRLRQQLQSLPDAPEQDSQALLERARAALNQGEVTPEAKRRVLELLLEEVIVHTVQGENGRREARIEVRWRV